MNTVTTPRHGLADLYVASAEATDRELKLAFAWADQKPEERGYPHLIAAFLAVVRACETVQGRRE
jgi:hypothetical protein